MRGLERQQLFYLIILLVVLAIVFALVISPLIQGDSAKRELELRKYCIPWFKVNWAVDEDTLNTPELAPLGEQAGLKAVCESYLGHSINTLDPQKDWNQCKKACLAAV